ncbi:hypothetical protein [Amycolatopsis jejuensis]|uniref:hypothetical protein n=1 Tax=Amycolatopsis jejuensis TaxID=330084 RepID=UPI00068A1876|nr:hypothetical protein [Amycolatopsis jejuensis]
MAETSYSSERVKNAAINLKNILQDLKEFDALKEKRPDAGKFMIAQWLEMIVDDRRNAIVAHAEHLNLIFKELEAKLTKLAQDFNNLDGDNAKKFGKELTDLQNLITEDLGNFDQNTEKDQTNYSNNYKKDPSDGNGYNANLGAGLGKNAPEDEKKGDKKD